MRIIPEIDQQSEQSRMEFENALGVMLVSSDLEEIDKVLDPDSFLNGDPLLSDTCFDMELAVNEQEHAMPNPNEASLTLMLQSLEYREESSISFISKEDLNVYFESLPGPAETFSEDQKTILSESEHLEIEALLDEYEGLFNKTKFQEHADTTVSRGITSPITYTLNKKQTFFGDKTSTERTISEKRIKVINEFLESSKFSEYKFKSISLTSNSQILKAVDVWWSEQTDAINPNTQKKQTNGELWEEFLHAKLRRHEKLWIKKQLFYINSAIDLTNSIKSLDDHNYCSKTSFSFTEEQAFCAL